MPPYFGPTHVPKDLTQNIPDHDHVDESPAIRASSQELDRLGQLHRQTTQTSRVGLRPDLDPQTELKEFLQDNNSTGKWYPQHSGVGFESLSVFGSSDAGQTAKTLGTALWRTLTFQDVAEMITPSALRRKKAESKAIISGFSGVVHSGEMML